MGDINISDDSDSDCEIQPKLNLPSTSGLSYKNKTSENISKRESFPSNLQNNSKTYNSKNYLLSDNQEHRKISNVGKSTSNHWLQFFEHQTIQSSSTSWNDKKQKILVWNQLGILSISEIKGVMVVNVRFSNTMGPNLNEQFKCADNFQIGSLSNVGACLCTTSVLYYHPFTKFDHLQGCNQTFRKHFGKEIVLATTMGDGWVAVATSLNFLRVYTTTGLEFRIICLTGKPICLSSIHTRLLIAYQPSRSQELKLDIIDFSLDTSYTMHTIIKNQTIPLANNSTLVWLGFDIELAVPIAVTSSGLVMQLLQLSVGQEGWWWSPILNWNDIRKNTEDIFYPIFFKSDIMCYIPLRGDATPPIYPTPNTSTSVFHIQLSRESDEPMDSAQQSILQSVVRDSIKLQQLDFYLFENSTRIDYLTCVLTEDDLSDIITSCTNEYEKNVLRVYQRACKLLDNKMAKNCVLLLRSAKAINVAIQIANNFNCLHTVEFAQLIGYTKFPDNFTNPNDVEFTADEEIIPFETDLTINNMKNISDQHTSIKQKPYQIPTDLNTTTSDKYNSKPIKNPFAANPPPQLKSNVFQSVLALNDPSPVF
jgi:hypothetical protein